MTRRLRAPAALLPVLAACPLALSGCMDYQFNPIGRCVLQPGSVQVQLPKTSSADILFVVDDSPSMDPDQAALAASFKDFIQRMVETNVSRSGRGLDAIDFQIAVTTSSVFDAKPAETSCVGGDQCCATSACTNVASCERGTEQGCGGGQVCVTDPVLDPTFTSVAGIQARCCTPSACTASAGCAPGDRCPLMTTSFPTPLPSPSYCTPGVAAPGAPYAAGQYVSAGSNPKVLSFPKTLGWATWGTAAPDPRLLQIVWVGDEDDCSSPQSAPLTMASYTPGADSCVFDKHLPASSQREIAVADYARFFEALTAERHVSDLAAAFIVSAARCGNASGGERFLALADQLRAAGIDIVEGAVCDPFGPLLSAIADLAKPPSMLELPTLPGARAVTTVEILDASGQMVKACVPGADWCFMDCANPDGPCLAAGTSQCIAIDHVNGHCEAQAGQTYSAEYLGMLPAGGCLTGTDCASALGGGASAWTCVVETGMARGTCTCQGK